MNADYGIDVDREPHTAVLSGVFRLATPEQYDGVFAPIATRLAAAPEFTVDLCDVVLMNSSGLRALAELVMTARRNGTPLTFLGRSAVPWHSKSVASLQPLYSGLTVRLS